MINRWHVWVWLGTQFLLTSIFTKKSHKLFLTVGSWLDMLMTQDASASANQKWVCWWLVELHRSEEKIGCNQIWEKGYTARPLDAGSIFNMGLTRLHFCLNWYDMLLGGKTSHAHIFFFFFFFKDWTKPSISRLLKTHCLSSQPHRGSRHHWILSDKKKPMRQELQESA